jgi:hypothetical protein
MFTRAVQRGPESGWPSWTFACLGAAVPVLGAFVGWELFTARRGRTPLVNVALFANPSFAAGAGVSLVYFAGFIGLLFDLSIYLQAGLGWKDAGSASGVLNAAQRLGQAIGVAVVGVALFGDLPGHGGNTGQPATAHPSGPAARSAWEAAFAHSTQVASLYALGAMIATFLLIFLLPRSRDSLDRVN